MIRTFIVFVLIALGIYFSFRGPFFVLLFYIWNGYFRPEQWVWSDTIESLRLSYVIGLVLVASFLFSAERSRFNGRVLVLFLFLLHSFVSSFLSPYSAVSWAYWPEFAKVVIVTYLITMLVNDSGRLRLILMVMAFSLGFEGAKQGWVEMLRHPGAENMNPSPFLGDNNGVAVGMLMLVAIFLALEETASAEWEKNLHRFFAVGVLYRALATYSRGGFLAALALGGVYLLRTRRKGQVLVKASVAIFLLLSVLSAAYWNRMSTISSNPEVEDESSISRLHIWQVALLMGDANPLTGCGFHAFEACYDDFDFAIGAHHWHRAAHSAWFGVFGEQGYPGLALYIVIVVSALRACGRVRRQVADHPEGAALGAYASALESGLWVFVVGGSFLSFHLNEMVWHFFGLTIALEAIAARVALPVSESPPSEPERLAANWPPAATAGS